MRSLARQRFADVDAAGKFPIELAHQRGAEGVVRCPQISYNGACARRDKRSDQACDPVLSLIGTCARVAERVTRAAFSRRSRISRACRSPSSTSEVSAR
jgi:hypothetical protein